MLEYTDYNEVVYTVSSDDLDAACDIAGAVNTGGFYVEDSRHLEEEVEEIAGKGVRAVFQIGTVLCGNKDFVAYKMGMVNLALGFNF